jgi:hypothetical protein
MNCVSVRAKGANANGLILAVDLGKCKSVIRVYKPSEPSWHTASFSTNHALLQVLRHRLTRRSEQLARTSELEAARRSETELIETIVAPA